MQYGTRISAFVLYLLHDQLLPEKRLAGLMAELFGVKLVTATIAVRSAPAVSQAGRFFRVPGYNHLADGVGFEPTVRLHARRFSRPLP